MLAGALRDNGRGKIVGETTFGKGLIQTIVELSDGSGVAVTVARYQTPDGTDINKRGIQPDISIPTGKCYLHQRLSALVLTYPYLPKRLVKRLKRVINARGYAADKQRWLLQVCGRKRVCIAI